MKTFKNEIIIICFEAGKLSASFWLYVNSWGKKTQKMKRSKGSGRKVAALNYENICKMRFLNLLKLEYP